MNIRINLEKLNKYFVLKYGSIICIVCFFAACQSRNHDSRFGMTNSLTIVCDSSINRNLLYDFNLISNGDTIKTHNIKHDSIAKTTTLKWDSLRNNDYRFEVISVFQQKTETSFSLNRDTTIKINNKYRYELKDVISKETLLKSDTIIFALQTTGCSYNIGIYTLTKENGKYKLKGSKKRGLDPIDNEVSSDIINDLYKIQIYCRNHKFQEYISTRAYQFMLLTDNKVFYFDDKYYGDGEVFSQFGRRYIYER